MFFGRLVIVNDPDVIVYGVCIIVLYPFVLVYSYPPSFLGTLKSNHPHRQNFQLHH